MSYIPYYHLSIRESHSTILCSYQVCLWELSNIKLPKLPACCLISLTKSCGSYNLQNFEKLFLFLMISSNCCTLQRSVKRCRQYIFVFIASKPALAGGITIFVTSLRPFFRLSCSGNSISQERLEDFSLVQAQTYICNQGWESIILSVQQSTVV